MIGDCCFHNWKFLDAFSAGFYICWGCLVWVPSIYTSPGMYLVNHPVNLGAQVSSTAINFLFQFSRIRMRGAKESVS